jgi:hypothetical protein
VKPLRSWILAVALGCFAAGTAMGWLLPSTLDAFVGDDDVADPGLEFVRRFAADFALSTDQRRLLLVVVRDRQQEELRVLRRAEFEQLPAALQSQIKNARRREEERIRFLLTPEQRERFDRQVRPDPYR